MLAVEAAVCYITPCCGNVMFVVLQWLQLCISGVLVEVMLCEIGGLEVLVMLLWCLCFGSIWCFFVM